MHRIEDIGEWSDLRMHTKAMSNQALYDYIMLLKYWFLCDAVERLKFDGTVAWIDFGFNHGNECYIDSNDFDFYWNPVIDNRIHLYARSDPNKRNSMLSLLLQCDCIMGCPILLPSNKCRDLWNYCYMVMKSLIALDAIDDDQQLLMMVYKLYSEEFCIQYSNWFLPMKENGGEHLKVREDYGNIKKDSFYNPIKKWGSKLWFLLKRDYSRPTPYNYGKRISKYAEKIT